MPLFSRRPGRPAAPARKDEKSKGAPRQEWAIAFPSGLYERVSAFLEEGSPLENGCYLRADWHASGSGQRLLVREAVLPVPGSWSERGPGSISPSSAYLNRAVEEADRAGSCLLFVHTHPSPDHPPSFSGTDESANRTFFRDMAELLDGRPAASAVVSGAGMHAVAHHGGSDHKVSRIDVVGKTLGRADRGAPCRRDGAAGGVYARQASMLGPETHGRVRGLDVCVVGAGGVGSGVAVQLARLGVRRIRLIDPDSVEESNVSRLHGSSRRHVGAAKADVVREHLESFSDSEVRSTVGDVCRKEHLEAAMESDAVICCTDSMRSRDRLNAAALEHYRPLIDVGCNVVTKGRFEATIRAQLVTPSTACLWCTGQIDGMRLADECLDEGQRRAKEESGYYEPHQPSAVTLTTWAACLGTDKLLGLLGMYGGSGGSVSYVDVANEFCDHRTPAVKPGCFCGSLRFG